VAIIEKQSLGQTNFNKQKICLLIFKCKCFCYFRSEIKSSIAYQYQLKRRPHYFNITILPSKYLKRNLLDLLSGFLTPIQTSEIKVDQQKYFLCLAMHKKNQASPSHCMFSMNL